VETHNGYIQLTGDRNDMSKCIGKIYNALIDLEMVWDRNAKPHNFAKFRPGGKWSNPKDLKAISFSILNKLIKFHRHGLARVAFRGTDVPQPAPFDLNFTFLQRLQFVTFLLRRFKGHANQFMTQALNDVRVAMIWSVLMKEKAFKVYWEQLPDLQKDLWVWTFPYSDVTVNDEAISWEEAQRVVVGVLSQSHPVAPQSQQEAFAPAPTPARWSTAAGKRPAVDDLETEAGSSSRPRMAAPQYGQPEQYKDLPQIPHFDGPGDVHPPTGSEPSQAETGEDEVGQSVALDPLQELLEMGDEIFNKFFEGKEVGTAVKEGTGGEVEENESV